MIQEHGILGNGVWVWLRSFALLGLSHIHTKFFKCFHSLHYCALSLTFLHCRSRDGTRPTAWS